MQTVRENFCIYHVNAPGQESGETHKRFVAALDSFSDAAKMQKRISFQQKLAAAANTKF